MKALHRVVITLDVLSYLSMETEQLLMKIIQYDSLLNWQG